MRYLHPNLMLFVFFVAFWTLSCGEDAPNTPPVDEWCDLERPREACELDYVRIESLEDMAAICESPCTRISLLAIENNVDNEILKELNGFTYIRSVNIASTHSNVKDLSFLRDVVEMQNLRVMDNPGLESLAGLEGVEFVNTCDMCERRIEISANPSLRSFKGLENITDLDYLTIMDNNNLEEVNGFDKLKGGIITIDSNARIRRIAGFAGMVNNPRGINIFSNLALKRLELWPNLKSLGSISIDRNPSLNMCDVDRILNQLDEPPQTNIKDTNGPPCATL